MSDLETLELVSPMQPSRDQDALRQVDERVMARDFDRQAAELQVRAEILNRFTQFGTPETVRVT